MRLVRVLKTPKIPKIQKPKRLKAGGVERQLRALIISDDELDRYNIHNPLAEVMDISEEDWD